VIVRAQLHKPREAAKGCGERRIGDGAGSRIGSPFEKRAGPSGRDAYRRRRQRSRTMSAVKDTTS